jgi:N-acetylglucosamine malate deacetylase 1
MRIPFARKATGLLRNLRAPWLFRRMVRGAILAEPTLAPALIIAPHADDETFGCGGIIALKRRQGVPVTVVIVTDGAASHPDRNPAELIAERQAEALAATAHLGVPASEVVFINGPDGQLTSLPPDQHAAIVNTIANLLTAKQPTEVYAPRSDDRHPDHEATNRLVRQAIAQASNTAGPAPKITLLEYPVWLLWWAPVGLPASAMNLDSARRIDIGPAARQKADAIAVYHSQLPSMPRNFMAQFTGGFELFFVAETPHNPPA